MDCGCNGGDGWAMCLSVAVVMAVVGCGCGCDIAFLRLLFSVCLLLNSSFFLAICTAAQRIANN
jgi:hypothetical protein